MLISDQIPDQWKPALLSQHLLSTAAWAMHGMLTERPSCLLQALRSATKHDFKSRCFSFYEYSSPAIPSPTAVSAQSASRSLADNPFYSIRKNHLLREWGTTK